MTCGPPRGTSRVLRRWAAAPWPGGQLDKVERAFQVVEGAADQMNSMIDAMLALSHSTLRPLTQAAVNLNALMEQARSHVEDEGEGRRIEWRVETLPQVMGDAGHLAAGADQPAEQRREVHPHP